MLKALCPFQPFSNCLCCVSPTLRCPLISSLRQDLSFSHLLTSFFECNLTHSTQFSPFLLFPPLCPSSFFTCCFFFPPSTFCAIASALNKNAVLFLFSSFGAHHMKVGRSAASAWVQEQCTSWIRKSWRSRAQQFYFDIFRARGRFCETQRQFPHTVHEELVWARLPNTRASSCCHANMTNFYTATTKSYKLACGNENFSELSVLFLVWKHKNDWLPFSPSQRSATACWRRTKQMITDGPLQWNLAWFTPFFALIQPHRRIMQPTHCGPHTLSLTSVYLAEKEKTRRYFFQSKHCITAKLANELTKGLESIWIIFNTQLCYSHSYIFYSCSAIKM